MFSAGTPLPLRALLGCLLALVASVAVAVLTVAPAAAHVDLVESVPANVSSVPGPVGTVTFRYSGEVEPVADRFRIVDVNGIEIPIDSVDAVEPEVVVVTPAEPLPVGRTRVTWALRGADGHTMTGAIAFTVMASSGASIPVAPAESAAPGLPSTDDQPVDDPIGSIDGPSAGADWVATFARWVVFGAVLFCAGGLVYVTTVHRGTRAESRRLVFYVRRAAVVVIVASVVEWLAQLVVHDFGSAVAVFSPAVWWDLSQTGFGIGTALRLVGAGLVLAFLSVETDSVSPDSVSADASASLARVRVEASSLAFVGAFVAVASESFIGHTSSVQPRLLMIISDLVHLVAGGAWAAGAFLLASTLWRRHRRGEPTDARMLAARFSVVAAGSLVAVGVTGIVLAWLVLTGPGASWMSDFGRLLLVKAVLVAVVASIGGYNHRVMVPALADGDEQRAQRFRWIVTAESVVFAVILFVTALLVNADPNG